MAATSTSTTVDLSRLRAPIIVEQKTFETIVAEMVAQVQALLPSFDATVDSDPAVKVLQVAAYREMLVRRSFQDGGEQLMVAFATGGRLDHLGALVGVARLVVTPANFNTGAVYEDDDTYGRTVGRSILRTAAMNGMDRRTGKPLAGADHLKQSIEDILGTPLGTRLGRRDYGSELPELMDQPMNELGRIRVFAATALAIMRQERRARISRIGLAPGDRPGAFAIRIVGRRVDVAAAIAALDFTIPVRAKSALVA